MSDDRTPGSAGDPASAAIRAVTDAPAHRPFVVAQLGQALDGRIATPTGESRWINRDAALDHVHRLRASVDAVVVGIGTVLADDPLLNVRRVPGRHPARIVIDPSGRLPETARCLAAGDGVERIVICADDVARTNGAATVIPLPRKTDRSIDPRRIVDALYRRGLRRLLIEGGARTVSAFLDAGAVDRLHVLVAPVILGSGKTGLDLKPIAALADALRPPTEVYPLPDGDVLFDCDLAAIRKGD